VALGLDCVAKLFLPLFLRPCLNWIEDDFISACGFRLPLRPEEEKNKQEKKREKGQ
jgi:hypothetical protein